jgi:hypothetical protein
MLWLLFLLSVSTGRLYGQSRSVDRSSFHDEPELTLLGQSEPPNSPTGQGNKKKKYSPSATSGSPGHIFWVIPAFHVNYGKSQALTPKEKLQEWARGAYDPMGFGLSAFEAGTIEYSPSDGFCDYGGGWLGYGKCFGSLELDAHVSSFIGDLVLTVAFHQDPRYFRLGEGSFRHRLWYAASRVFVTFNNSGEVIFYSSALTGTAAGAGISNLYYPQKDRGLHHTLTRVAIDLGNTVAYNAAAEFWPDIHQHIHFGFFKKNPQHGQ